MDKFPNIRKFSWKSKKKQSWNTQKQSSASGKVRTLTTQLYPLWTIEASYPALTDEETREIFGFCALHKGSNEPFLWLDPEDYQEKGIRLVGVNGEYQAVMRMGDFVEPVDYIEDVTVYADGAEVSGYTVDGGVIKFDVPPAGVLTADYTYYWKVMLKDDGFSVDKIFKNINKATFTLVSAR